MVLFWYKRVRPTLATMIASDSNGGSGGGGAAIAGSDLGMGCAHT